MHTKSMQRSVQKWLPEVEAGEGPLYLAISAALARDIEDGRLHPGDRLPPQRDLAGALGVDLGTVTRAYSEARRLGLIAAEGRRGSFVRAGRGRSIPADVAPFDTGMNLPPIPERSTLGDSFAGTVQEILRSPAAANRLQYQPSGGAPADRQAGAEWLAERNIECGEDNVLVTSGAQTALHAIASSLLDEGDAVCCAPFVYPGWLSICRHRRLKLVPLATDADGIDPEAFERACAVMTIRALYLVPANENPTTVTMPLSRREALVAVARRHDVAIIEDAAYCHLLAQDIPAFARLAPERTWHVASLSKIISPALRIAYLRAPLLRDALRLCADLHGTTIMPPPLNMAACTIWLRDGTWTRLVDEVRAECRARQEIVAEILPQESYQAAAEGYHLWVPATDSASPFELAGALQPLGVSVVLSERFSADPAMPGRAVRLSIGGNLDRDRLRRALGVLDGMLHHRGGRASPLV